jgi:tRNA(Arg) A34 adenosine deaminase TadA
VISDDDVRAAITRLKALHQGSVPWPFWIGETNQGGTEVRYLAKPWKVALPEAIQLVRALGANELGTSLTRGIIVPKADALLQAINELVDFSIWRQPQMATLHQFFPQNALAQPQGRLPALTPVKMPKGAQFISPDAGTPGVDITKSARGQDHDGHHTIHRVYMMLAFALLSARGVPAQQADQNIAALLVAPDGKILGWAVNQKSKHPMLHAETTLVLDWIVGGKGAVPQGCRVYTTLQSCKMCAAVLMSCAKDVFVYYGQQDGGEHAQSTALSTAGRESVLPRDVMAVAKGQVGQGPRELSTRLSTGWAIKKGQATNSYQKTAWAFLRSDARQDFDNAESQLRVKFQQYYGQARKERRNPHVEKVIEHVIMYGVAIGVSEAIRQSYPWVKDLKHLAS